VLALVARPLLQYTKTSILKKLATHRAHIWLIINGEE
jgi:hypothetical protein